MQRNHSCQINSRLESLSHKATLWSGSSWAFLIAILLTIAWLATGPLFAFSDTWQLVMNTFTSIVTFLMVFLIQRSQNKDALAMQVKLNELIAAMKGASNRLIDVENLCEADVRELHERYQKLATRAQQSGRLTAPVSIEQVAPVPPK
jgi:low affinity Fe/Cu permease